MPLIDPVTMSNMGTASQASSKPSLPIELLPTDLARIISHIQPVLVLSTYYLRFSGLVADPASSLLIGLIPLIITQSVYCVICLPPAGSTIRSARKGQKSKVVTGKKDGGPVVQISVSAQRTTLHIHERIAN